MWIYRLALTKAKELALTGRALSGAEAAAIGLVNRAVPFAQLEDEIWAEARRLASIPLSQLLAMKLVVNRAYEHAGTRRKRSASSRRRSAKASASRSPSVTASSAITVRHRRRRSRIQGT